MRVSQTVPYSVMIRAYLYRFIMGVPELFCLTKGLKWIINMTMVDFDQSC